MDPDGNAVFINGTDAESAAESLSDHYSFKIKRDLETGLLSAYDPETGMAIMSTSWAKNETEKEFLSARFGTSIHSELLTT